MADAFVLLTQSCHCTYATTLSFSMGLKPIRQASSTATAGRWSCSSMHPGNTSRMIWRNNFANLDYRVLQRCRRRLQRRPQRLPPSDDDAPLASLLPKAGTSAKAGKTAAPKSVPAPNPPGEPPAGFGASDDPTEGSCGSHRRNPERDGRRSLSEGARNDSPPRKLSAKPAPRQRFNADRSGNIAVLKPDAVAT